MFDNNYYNSLEELQHINKHLYKNICSNDKKILDELSIVSHSVMNYISFINCSYQYISKTYPETQNFEYWPDIKDTLSDLINYINRTSGYRYSFKVPELLSFNLQDFFKELPYSLLELPILGLTEISLDSHQWVIDISSKIITIKTDRHMLKSAIGELIKNALDYNPKFGTITISSNTDNNNNLYICVSYESTQLENFKNHSLEELTTPFFSTNPEHAGLGLNIVQNISNRLGAEFTINVSNNRIENRLTFKNIQS